MVKKFSKKKPFKQPAAHQEKEAVAKGYNLANAEIGELKKYKWQALFAPVDGSTVAFFRIAFGIIMFWETIRYFQKGWIGRYWIDPDYHFTYWPFDFLQPLPAEGMYFLWIMFGVLSVLIMIGLLYRLSTFLFFIGFTYCFLLEQTRYLNHLYLVVLISFVLIFIPANKTAAVDNKIFKPADRNTVPAWSVWLLRFMIGLPYFFGGIAKINSDWLQGEPMRSWLSARTDFPVIGHLFTEEWMIYFMCYSGLLIDLLMVPLLLIKPTRKWAFLVAVLFHLTNAELFNIGIFPWFTMIASTIFFHPSWPRKFVNLLSTARQKQELRTTKHWTVLQPLSYNKKIAATLLLTWIAIQVLVPLRHFIIPGNVHWNEMGHKYAWHMKLRSKDATAVFIVRDKKTDDSTFVSPEEYLTSWQINRMSDWPELIWQFAQILKKENKKNGLDVEVYADVKASLNGRAYQQMIDPSTDLSAVERPGFIPPKWIIPLTTPLSARAKKRNAESEE